MNWFILLLAGLAVFRLSELIAVDNGPGDIFLSLRHYIASNAKLGPFSGLVECFYCASIWMSLLVTIGLWLVGAIPGNLSFLWWMGIAGLAGIIYRVWRKR